jgi:transglutaminase-like putative cysteine protease
LNTSTNLPGPANLHATPILDHGDPSIHRVASELRSGNRGEREFVQAAHQYVARHVKPVYSLNELQPASRTLQKQVGSCSQRMACLEAIARAGAVPTRVRVLQVSGRFWHPRFPVARVFMPNSILLVWPQFYLNGAWADVDELYGSAAELAKAAKTGFSNMGESVFDAIDHTPVDFLGKTCAAGCSSGFDLSKFLLADNGLFDTRDEAFERFGSMHSTLRGLIFEVLFGGRSSS